MEYKEVSPATAGEEQLRYDIQTGIFDKMSERELATHYGISRTAMRRSLSVLQSEGLIEKKPRVGMIINKKHVINMLAMSSMSDELNADDIRTEILKDDKVVLSPTVKRFLGTGNVFNLSRKRIIKDKPISYEIAFLSSKKFCDINRIDFKNQSLYKVLKDKYNVIPSYGHETIKLGYADERQASILKVPEKTLLYVVTSLAYDDNDDSIEYSVQYLIGNQIRYRLNAKNIFDYREDGDLE